MLSYGILRKRSMKYLAEPFLPYILYYDVLMSASVTNSLSNAWSMGWYGLGFDFLTEKVFDMYIIFKFPGKLMIWVELKF